MSTNPLAQSLERLHAELSRLDHGEVANYIPELGRANPDHFGICIATTDGHVYQGVEKLPREVWHKHVISYPRGRAKEDSNARTSGTTGEDADGGNGRGLHPA